MAMQPCLYSTLRLLVRQFRDRSPPVPLHLAIACRDPCMAVLGPDPEEPGLCCSPWVHLRGPVHGARERTVLHRCSRKASYGFLPSVAGHGPCPTARRGQWPKAAFAATTTGHAASAGATRLAGPPPRRRAPWHGAVPRRQACGFLLSPICDIKSPTDFTYAHTVCCTPYRRRKGGR